MVVVGYFYQIFPVAFTDHTDFQMSCKNSTSTHPYGYHITKCIKIISKPNIFNFYPLLKGQGFPYILKNHMALKFHTFLLTKKPVMH